ncbi:MAG: hypothetical protein ABL940_08825 [Bacteroidia bacterium]
MSVILTLRPDNIIHVDVTCNEVLSNVEFFEIIDELRIINKMHNTVFPCIITANEQVHIEKDVKDLVKSKLFKKYTLASAIITPNESQHLYVNVFLRLSHLKSPVRSFKTKERALIWLQQYAN